MTRAAQMRLEHVGCDPWFFCGALQDGRRESMLAASFDPGQPSSQVNVSSTPISTPGGVGAKPSSIWGDESEEDE